MDGGQNLSPFTGPATLSPTGLSLGEQVSFEEWLAVGEQLKAAERSLMWWIGDWLRYGERRWSEMYAQALEATDYSYQTCRDAAWVAGKIDLSRRRDNLSWSHHKEVAALDTPQQDEWLDRAEAESWSRRELRTELRRHRNVIGLPAGPDTCQISDLETAAKRGWRFGTVYADPPWLYGNQGTRAATGNHYDGMTVEEISALPIAKLLPEQAHLHLWTTNAFLFDARSVMEAWGFEYKSCFVWVKPEMGIGNYWRVSHEFLLLGVRGALTFSDRAQKSWGEFSRGKHSAKPENVRHIIESTSPGPRLELFGRAVVPGWTVWGDNVGRDIFTHGVPEVA